MTEKTHISICIGHRTGAGFSSCPTHLRERGPLPFVSGRGGYLAHEREIAVISKPNVETRSKRYYGISYGTGGLSSFRFCAVTIDHIKYLLNRMLQSPVAFARNRIAPENDLRKRARVIGKRQVGRQACGRASRAYLSVIVRIRICCGCTLGYVAEIAEGKWHVHSLYPASLCTYDIFLR